MIMLEQHLFDRYFTNIYGIFFKLPVHFFLCLSINRSINIEYDKMI